MEACCKKKVFGSANVAKLFISRPRLITVSGCSLFLFCCSRIRSYTRTHAIIPFPNSIPLSTFLLLSETLRSRKDCLARASPHPPKTRLPSHKTPYHAQEILLLEDSRFTQKFASCVPTMFVQSYAAPLLFFLFLPRKTKVS